MESNWDGVIGKRPSEPHSAIHPGESVHKIALFRIDVFGTDVITTLTATRPPYLVGPAKAMVTKERRIVKATGRRKIMSSRER